MFADENPPTPVQTPAPYTHYHHSQTTTPFGRPAAPPTPRQLDSGVARTTVSNRLQESIQRRRAKREEFLLEKSEYLTEKKKDAELYDHEEDRILVSECAQEGMSLEEAIYHIGYTGIPQLEAMELESSTFLQAAERAS